MSVQTRVEDAEVVQHLGVRACRSEGREGGSMNAEAGGR